MKKKTQALNLFAGTKMFLLCFIEQAKRLKRKRRRVELKEKQKNRDGGVPSCPPFKKHTGLLVGRTEPGVKGQRKGLVCAFRPFGAQTRIQAAT